MKKYLLRIFSVNSYIIPIITIFLTSGCSSHNIDTFVSIDINPPLKHRLKEKNIAEIVSLWKDYLSFVVRNNGIYKKYDGWEEGDIIAPDVVMYNIASSTDNFKINPLLIGIQQKDSIYILKTLFQKENKAGPELQSIFNVIVTRSGTSWKISDYHSYITKDWETDKIGNISYKHRNGSRIDTLQAKKMNGFSQKFAAYFDTKVKDITCYVYDNSEERARAMGFDFNYYMFDDNQNSGEAGTSSLADTISKKASLKDDISAVLTDENLNKNGRRGLKAILTNGTSDDSFYYTIEKQLNVKQRNLDQDVRYELKQYDYSMPSPVL